MLKEQVAEILKPLARNYVLGYIHNLNKLDQETTKVERCYTSAILNLFKAEIEKLTVMGDEEVGAILEAGFNFNTKPTSLEHIQRIIQLQDTKKQLLDLMGINKEV